MMDTHLTKSVSSTGSNEITKQLKILYYNPFVSIKEVVFSFSANNVKDEPLVFYESIALMVVHDSMHRMELTFVNVGVDARHP